MYMHFLQPKQYMTRGEADGKKIPEREETKKN
jgi:hypothetical protein